MYQKFTDTEFAVTVDSLAEMRDQIAAKGLAAPNVKAALRKFNSWSTPAGCQFVAVPGEKIEVTINQAQRDALAFYFSKEADAYDDNPNAGIILEVDNGQLVLNGAYLHSDGEFATFPEGYK